MYITSYVLDLVAPLSHCPLSHYLGMDYDKALRM